MSIDEILANYYRKTIRVDGNTPNARQEAKQALYKDMVELIGEDEPIELKESVEAIEMKLYANTTRQELRTKLKEYFGVKDD